MFLPPIWHNTNFYYSLGTEPLNVFMPVNGKFCKPRTEKFWQYALFKVYKLKSWFLKPVLPRKLTELRSTQVDIDIQIHRFMWLLGIMKRIFEVFMIIHVNIRIFYEFLECYYCNDIGRTNFWLPIWPKKATPVPNLVAIARSVKSLWRHQCLFDSHIKGLHMFVNQVLFRYENFAGICIWLFGILECCSLHFNQNIAKSFKKLSNSGLQKPLKSSKFWIFSEMLM